MVSVPTRVVRQPDKVRYLAGTLTVVSVWYLNLLEKQGGVCAICFGQPQNRRGFTSRLDVDHCHVTKKVRGLLCNACNKALGCFKDSPVNLRSALLYLEVNA